MIASEVERQFYLAAAGIRMWYARDTLPGAAPSPDFDFGDEGVPAATPDASPVDDGGVPAPQPVSGERSRERIAQLQSLMGGQSGSSRSTEVAREAPATGSRPTVETTPSQASRGSDPVVAEEPVAVTPAHRPEAVPRMCVTAWEGSGVVLLCNVSEDASFALQDNLARNILRSLGKTEVSQRQVVRWPLFNNLKISLNSEHDLATVLADNFSITEAKQKLITLGFEQESQARVVRDSLRQTPDLAFPGTLSALASDPSLKRQLWQALQDLLPIR